MSFAPSATPLTLDAGQPYTIAFYAISAIAATPTPTFTGKIYVLNSGNSTLTTYTANGAPTTPTITGLSGSRGVAVDAAGKIYVANYSGNTVTTYTANGTPTTPTITGLDAPVGVAVDAAGKIYVLNRGNSTLTTYTANGTPTTPTITGLKPPFLAGFRDNLGVAVDAVGKIYVASTTYQYGRFNLIDLYGMVTTYTANGAPSTPTIGGEGNAVVVCGVVVDAAGKIYVVSDNFGCSDDIGGNNTVTTYTAAGVQTTPTITGLSDPKGVAVDAVGKIYVANAGNNTVTTYTANGTRTTPAITGLSAPVGIAVH